MVQITKSSHFLHLVSSVTFLLLPSFLPNELSLHLVVFPMGVIKKGGKSGQENVKNSRHIVIFGVISPFYKGQNGSKFSQNKSGQAGGG